MAENVPNLARDKPTDLSWANVTQDIPQATNAKVKVLVTQSCLTLCDPVDCSPPGSSVRGILQARTLEWVAILFSRGSSWPRDQTQVSSITGGFFTIWDTREKSPSPKMSAEIYSKLSQQMNYSFLSELHLSDYDMHWPV